MPIVNIKIDLPPESQALLKELSDMPQEVPQAIKRGMDRSLAIVAGRIQQNRLSGIGPFPVAEHRLGERTGQLRRSVRAEPAVIAGNSVVGEIGTPVIYGSVHEFGATIVPRQAKFLVFTIEGRKILARRVVIPARAPFQTEVLANTQFIADEIANELDKLPKKP